jgi:O-antigen/teichoic acid export membrane protein
MDTGWVAVSQAASRGLVFVAVVVLARLLSVHDFAAYVVLLAIWTILVPLADVGMWPVVTRAASHDSTGRLFRYTGEADRARAPAWGVAIAIAAIGAVAGLPHAGLFLLAVVAAIGQAEVDTASGELSGRRRFAAASALRLAPGVIGLAGAVALPLFGTNTVAAVAVFAAARVLPAAALRVAVPISASGRSLSLRQGIPFGVTTGLMMVYVSSDLILLSAFGIAAAGVAVYGVAYRTLVGLQAVIPGSVAMAVYPRVAAATRNGSQRLIPLGAGGSACISAALLALLFLDLRDVFSIFGPSYAANIGEVRPLLMVLIPTSISLLYISGLQARHHERPVLRLVSAVAAVNVLGNTALIPLLGIRGALLATSAAEWLAALGALAMAIRLCATPSRDVFPCLGLLVPVCLGFLPVPGPLVSLALVVWLIVVWETNAFDLRTAVERVRHERRMVPAPGPGLN